ncbi:hypothetical protein DPMN_046469 [Dreissena polymorpha]|uniref:Protein-tyrosine sulfotransferase n=1 Tax=Dreissena polymorpha TaxID=45954 RepID=A0A9D4D7X5_DREPO|nr:hypothetical protein DPMN_046469 [Dreissena polymorpha]
MIMEEIKYWLTCDLEKLCLDSLMDSFSRKIPSTMKKLFDEFFNTSSGFQLFLRIARQRCLESKTIILKFIRLSIQQAIELLPFFPNMKIIHIVRDPRAIINSRRNVLPHVYRELEEAATLQPTLFCSRLQNDLSHTKLLLKLHPSIIKLVQYEDIAEHTFEASKDLYAFGGLKFDDKSVRFVKSQTQSRLDGCNYCTERRNSTATSIEWRSKIRLTEAQDIFNYCKKSMSVLGYLDLPDNQTLRDLSIPSRLRYNVTKILIGDDRF